jgi:glycosyltransferase involved in cell wall biosynthesis
VASRGGVLELVEHERTGFVVPPRAPAELARTLGRLLQSPSLGQSIGAAAASSAREHLDRRLMLRNLLDWCRTIHSNWHHRVSVGGEQYTAGRDTPAQ